MSDLDKLFEHAPDGAVEIVVYIDGDLRWATPSHTWSPNMKEWKDRPIEWKTIATRPQPERKTVEDAVEWNKLSGHGVTWAHEECDIITFDPSCDISYSKTEYDKSDGEYVICTREEFEACVAAKAKSKPEWTHTWNGNKCRVVFTEDYRSWIKGDALDTLVPTDSLKPIKPKITKAEKEKCAAMAGYFNINPAEFDEYMSKYEAED